MTEDFKEELSNFLDYLESKVDDVYVEEVKISIRTFKEDHSI